MKNLTESSPTTSNTSITADRILIVDDIADNLFLLQTVLEAEGYQIELATDGLEALAKIQTNPPDLVLLDVMMPGMNGFEVTRRIRDDHALPFIPVLLITGYDQITPADSFDVGADGFIRKPVDFGTLLDRIRSILQSQ